MTYNEAKKAAIKNGRLIKRKPWVFTRVGYDRVRESFFIEDSCTGKKNPYTPTEREKQATDWERA